jgi:hypothetical protein
VRLSTFRLGIDGKLPDARTARETEALAKMLRDARRRGRRAAERELRRRIATGTASADELRWLVPKRFADH